MKLRVLIVSTIYRVIFQNCKPYFSTRTTAVVLSDLSHRSIEDVYRNYSRYVYKRKIRKIILI